MSNYTLTTRIDGDTVSKINFSDWDTLVRYRDRAVHGLVWHLARLRLDGLQVTGSVLTGWGGQDRIEDTPTEREIQDTVSHITRDCSCAS